MNTIVLGFKAHANGKGTGPATLVAGPEVSGNEQAKIISDAKSKNAFPKGIAFLQMSLVVPRITAIALPAPAAEPKPKTKSEPKE